MGRHGSRGTDGRARPSILPSTVPLSLFGRGCPLSSAAPYATAEGLTDIMALAERWTCRLVLLALPAVPTPATAQADHAPPLLASLRVTGAGAMTPDFAPDVFHYALRCEARQALAVSAAAERDDVRLRINGQPATGTPAIPAAPPSSGLGFAPRATRAAASAPSTRCSNPRRAAS